MTKNMLKKGAILALLGIASVAVAAPGTVRITGLTAISCVNMSGDQNVNLYGNGGGNCHVRLDLGSCKNVPNGGPPNLPECECEYTNVDLVEGDCGGIASFHI